MIAKAKRPAGFPKVLTEGNARVTIYWQPNPSRRRNRDTGKLEPTGKVFEEYLLTYYEGARQVPDPKTGSLKTVPRLLRKKFGNLDAAEKEAHFVLNKLANAEGEVLKLSGLDRVIYVSAMQRAKAWRPDADLLLIVTDYVSARQGLPDKVSFQELRNFYLSRNPAGLPRKTVAEVKDELIKAKTNAGCSDVYLKDLRLRLGHFSEAFGVPISMVTGIQVQQWLDGLGKSGRTRNNYRRLIGGLFKFAIRRGYLPKDHSEIQAVEKVKDGHGEIEVFTPDELRKLFAACLERVKERKVWRTREDMVPYLAIAAFCGLRAAEIQRLDWSEVHLTGPERFIEVTAGKAKTASRRTVPISDNCAAWLSPHVKTSGPVAAFERSDKQLFIYLAEKAGVPWKHNGLRHSFISYRLAMIKNVHQVSLEAGNSPQMVFKHYRQLVRESEAAEWFAITPAKKTGADIILCPGSMPTETSAATEDVCNRAASP